MVNTVLGPVSPEDLGITLMHEHIVFGYPGWYGDATLAPPDRQAALKAGIELMQQLKDYGVKTFVDATPNEAGRDPELYREISEKTGVNIICATGFYYEEEGAPAYFKFRSNFADIIAEIYEMFVKEITEGIGRTGIRAGVIKLASSKGMITDYEKAFFRAAAKAQKETGVPIITHTQEGTMGPEQADLLLREGADPSRIMIGHMSDNTDIRYHLDVLNQGVYIGFDRMGLQGLVGCPMDRERYACIIGLIGIGYGDKIMISHDTIAHWLGRPFALPEVALPLIAEWHPTHLFKNIIPALRKAGITEEQISSLVSDLAGVMQVAGLHGGGSPQMETITMMSRYDLESLKGIAKYLAGIEKELARYERPTVTPRKMLERFRAMYQGR
ncbi:MAG: phosphotriesterase-related protein [Clostridia bacterium]|nr:phosphotriesterase-related protein [Clostridia bacterium]